MHGLRWWRPHVNVEIEGSIQMTLAARQPRDDGLLEISRDCRSLSTNLRYAPNISLLGSPISRSSARMILGILVYFSSRLHV